MVCDVVLWGWCDVICDVMLWGWCGVVCDVLWGVVSHGMMCCVVLCYVMLCCAVFCFVSNIRYELRNL